MAQALLVSDSGDPHIAAQVRTTLSQLGHVVETVGNKKEALARLAVSAPDLLIHDVRGGVKDEELLRTVRQDPNLANIPMIMIIANAGWGGLFESYKYGRELYLTKPFNPAELRAFAMRLFEPSRIRATQNLNAAKDANIAPWKDSIGLDTASEE